MDLSRENLEKLIKYIISFIRHPINGISQLPDWDWATLIFVQFIVSLISGVLAGLIQLSFWPLIQGLILIPIVSMVTIIVSSIFLYYTFMLLAKRELSPRRLFTLVILSNIPFFIFQTISPLMPIFTLFGFFFSALVLIKGLTENFALDRKLVTKVIGTLSLIYLIIWIWGRIDSYLLERSL